MHGKDAAGDKSVLDAEVPRLYPHHVVKHELQVQPFLPGDRLVQNPALPTYHA